MSVLHSNRLARIKRSAPRIISRSYEKVRKSEADGLSSPNYAGSSTSTNMPNDVELELQSEIYMKGGMAISVSGAAAKFAEQQHQATLNHHYSYGYPISPVNHSAIISSENEEEHNNTSKKDEKGFIELPGVANEVESYPCPLCVIDKVFLTVNGLERHAQDEHPENISDIGAHIAQIQNEWNRRRILGVTSNAENHSAFASSSSVILMPTGRNKMNEVCRRCNYAVNVAHPGAMEYHVEAHKKNDELRQHLLDEYGERFVEFVTCKQCTLVFADGRALFEHIKNYHKRRNTGYVCRWCGKIFPGMSQLNSHKLQVHNIPVHNTPQFRAGFDVTEEPCDASSRISSTITGSVTVSKSSDVSEGDVVVVDSASANSGFQATSSHITVDDIHHTNARIVESLNNGSKIDDSAPCKTKCQICGLVIVKPSLLLRHMLRVHNKQEFVTDVTSRYTVPLKFSVFADGRVIWTCCDKDFLDRELVLTHRRLMHGMRAKNFLVQPIITVSTTTGERREGENILQKNANSDRTNNLQLNSRPVTCQEVLLDSKTFEMNKNEEVRETQEMRDRNSEAETEVGLCAEPANLMLTSSNIMEKENEENREDAFFSASSIT